jgi:hypothetical protein
MKLIKIILLSVFLIFVFVTVTSGQFEQKMTLQASWSYHHPIGEEAFTNAFGNGFSTDMGLQFNLSRSFSLATLFKFTTFKANVGAIVTKGFFRNFGISLCPKIRFFPSKKVNPYIFAGGSVSRMRLNYVTNNGTEYNYKPPIAFGYTGGAGVDFKVSDVFAFFIQGGYNSIYFKDKTDNNFKMNINSVYGEAGIHISFIKSKSL